MKQSIGSEIISHRFSCPRVGGIVRENVHIPVELNKLLYPVLHTMF